MTKKTVNFNQKGVSKVPNNKPAVYKIQTNGGKANYVGVAKRGCVQDRIQKHLNFGKISGAKVQIQQKSSIQEAKKIEARMIDRLEPKYNKRGK